ncbi:MAG: HAD-IIB family hydrolase [Nitrospirae bacterium]|nr:MAG: HAD-IIB family hydrolase [Nitrospirota bacterium]
MTQVLIFTDLDACLLDARSYSFDRVREALEAVRARHIPLVLVSSKTRAEIEPLRFRLQHRHPFVVENGGGLFIPKDYFDFPLDGATLRSSYQVIELGTVYATLRSALKEIEQALGRPLKGFGDMSAEEIAERTGLSPAEALLAKQREYDEPFVFEGPGSSGEEVTRLAEARGLRYTRGGRFHHLTGESDKGRACRLLVDCSLRQYRVGRHQLLTAGIGDSLNDLSMLAAVDYPILVQRPDGSYDPEVQLANMIRAPGIGPLGWNQAVLDLLKRTDNH